MGYYIKHKSTTVSISGTAEAFANFNLVTDPHMGVIQVKVVPKTVTAGMSSCTVKSYPYMYDRGDDVMRQPETASGITLDATVNLSDVDTIGGGFYLNSEYSDYGDGEDFMSFEGARIGVAGNDVADDGEVTVEIIYLTDGA